MALAGETPPFCSRCGHGLKAHLGERDAGPCYMASCVRHGSTCNPDAGGR